MQMRKLLQTNCLNPFTGFRTLPASREAYRFGGRADALRVRPILGDTELDDDRDAEAAAIDPTTQQLTRIPNSIDTLSPNNAFVREIDQIPIAAGVPFHTIEGGPWPRQRAQ